MEAGRGSEDAMIAGQISAGRGNQRGQATDEIQGLEDDRGRPVAPLMTKVDGYAVAREES
jgi:hypothetical protein